MLAPTPSLVPEGPHNSCGGLWQATPLGSSVLEELREPRLLGVSELRGSLPARCGC